MNAPRAAGWLIAFGFLATAAASSAGALETGAVLAAPEQPVAELPLERSVDETGTIAPGRRLDVDEAANDPALDVAVPDLPPVIVQVPAAEPAAPASAAIELPLPPEAPVSFTAQERFAIAFSRRLADDKGSWHPRIGRREREAVLAFYATRQNRPVWVADGHWTERANAVIARLREADEDGLEQGDYAIPALGVAQGGDSPADLAEAEMRLGISAILFARDARGARLDPSRLSSLITPKLELPDTAIVLTRLADGPDAGAALASYLPHHPGYVRLRERLASLRADRPSRPMVRVPAGPVLRLGMRDARVPLIRARFGLAAAEPGSDTAYDERVASAVADFQRQRGLPADGSLTRQTIVALGGGATQTASEADLIANMERWRWLPAELGERYIAVNVPEFRLRLMDGGAIAHQTRVITGKPDTPTPIFSGVMDHAIVNPSWNIPPSILKNEFLPRMAEDPLYAEKRGYQVVRRGNTLSIRQPPGERNALGFIKFMFPNQHAVYLHDTPNRTLFGAERRAFSHGCVRVEKPFELAEEVLGQSWSEERLKKLIGRGERTIKLGRTLPVHLTYFTVSVDESGALRQFDDLYGYNRRVRAALGLRG